MRNQDFKFWLKLFAYMVLGVLTTGGFDTTPSAAADNEINIGGSIPLSGKAAETGLNVYNGYQAAVKFINEEYGGVKVGGNFMPGIVSFIPGIVVRAAILRG